MPGIDPAALSRRFLCTMLLHNTPHIDFHARLDCFFGMGKQHPGDILTDVFWTASFTNQRWHLL